MVSDSNANGNGRKTVTMSLRSELLEAYRKYCEQHGYLLSRRLEILMKKDLEENKDEQ
jgi:hypothetical protein